MCSSEKWNGVLCIWYQKLHLLLNGIVVVATEDDEWNYESDSGYKGHKDAMVEIS